MGTSRILKSEISKKKVSLGSWVQLPDRYCAEIMAKAGFDWLAIDMEHGLIDTGACFSLIQVISSCGCVPLVRLNENDPSLIRRVMDAGACGIIVPMVNSKADAEIAVKSVKYPPEGNRSFGFGRTHDFGRTFDTCIKSSNNESIVVIQIEHIEAVKNIDEILSVPYIDAIIIGPYDLSGSMGIPGEFDHPQYKEMLERIIKKVKKTSLALGIHIVYPGKSDYQSRIREGFSFIGYGMDTIFLSQQVNDKVSEIRRV